ncbi:MAG: DEAD/DEAH box helicase [Actinobacteria bacterium]|jgi:translation initiation factor 4A|nr:DEAD/DEAH box helicase [Actinomycetota bacterium]
MTAPPTTPQPHPREFEAWEDIPDLNPQLMRGIYGYGFEKPSPIQQKSILSIIDGRDVIAQAQSGSGKTGAFATGALNCVRLDLKQPQALIIAPTRELAKQIHDVVRDLGTQMTGLNVQLLIGGTSTDDDVADLKANGPQILIGCPGRVHDILRRQPAVGRGMQMLVLDEADEMLSAGFNEQIYNIFQQLNTNVQVCLFSATMPPELHSLSDKFMRDPVRILVKSEMLTLEGISQYHVALETDHDKYATLKDLFTRISVSQCIIYCNSIRRVSDLAEAMTNDGFPVCCIHSGMEKEVRDKAYRDFRSGQHRVLISSNVTARGIDIQQVSTVINFDMPRDVHTYLHRIGRSGRWGRKGSGVNFITRRDFRKLKEIESYYGTSIPELPANFGLLN